MQWVGKEKEAIALETVGGEHRGRSAAHRPPAYDERLGLNLRSNTRNDRRESVFETRHRIRAAGFPFLVKEVEANYSDSARAQSVSRLKHATVVHVPAGAVCKNKNRPSFSAVGRWLEHRRCLLSADGDSPLAALQLLSAP